MNQYYISSDRGGVKAYLHSNFDISEKMSEFPDYKRVSAFRYLVYKWFGI